MTPRPADRRPQRADQPRPPAPARQSAGRPLGVLPQVSGADLPTACGRGASVQPPNRFERLHYQADFDQLDEQSLDEVLTRKYPTEYYDDATQSVVTRNNSPDVAFQFSLNPYRGCAHGCAYCYARPYHEMLGFSSGLDFETKILVKRDAPRLLLEFLAKPGWAAEPIVMSGVTDCYQPIERQLQLTRQCLEVALKFRQPMALITKNKLVTRDCDVLGEMAALGLASVAVSVTTLNQGLSRVLEPRTSAPQARLQAIAALAERSVPVTVMVAPIIPGLTDHEMPMIIKRAAEAGARYAGYTIVRLPLGVADVFQDWLVRHRPEQAEKILSRMRHMRGGKLNDSTFHRRMRGEGIWAEQIKRTFDLFVKRHRLNADRLVLDSSQFTRPMIEPPRSRAKSDDRQRRLF